MSGSVETRTVSGDEAGMRLDRWFKVHFPGLGFGPLQKLLRSGQIRVDGGRAKADQRVAAGQAVRLPPAVTALDGAPARTGPLTINTMRDQTNADALARMVVHEDEAVFVLNKPAGLAVQGGSGLNRHVDGMLEAWRNRKGEKPRLVHRIDRDTSGILVIARTRAAAVSLTAAFRARETEKIYWAICRGVPRPAQGRVSTWLLKEKAADGTDRMSVVRHGTPDSDHAESHYRVIDQAGQALAWMEWQPVTGRTHQLRVHAAHLGHPIVGDPKYFEVENWELPGGMQNRLHLHARRIRIPHPRGGILDVSAPLPPHMEQTFNLLGFELDSAGDDSDA